MANALSKLRSMESAHDMLLETRRRDGTWVATPVHLVVDGERIVFRTWSTSGKAKRLSNDPAVRVAPCTPRGRVTGEALVGEAHRLEGDAEAQAASLLNRKYPLLQAVLVRLYHRVRGLTTQHYEVTALR